MPQVLFYGALAIGGVLGFGWAAGKTEGALEEGTNLARWAVVGGGLYVGYKVAKTSGVIK